MNVNINLNDFIRELYKTTTFDSIELFDGFDKYLLHVRQSFSAGTHKCYQSHAMTMIKDFHDLRITTFNQIDNQAIYRYIDLLRNRRCTNSTINKRINTLLRCYKHLVKLGLLPHREFDYTKLKEKTPQLVVIDENTLKRILAHIPTLCDKSQLMILLMLSTGVRRTELTLIRLENISYTRNRIYLVDTKCDSGRYIFYDPQITELIQRVAEGNKTYLFEEADGNHISTNAVSMVVKRIAAHLNIKGLSPHKFRHTYATMLLKNGANIGAVRLLMGHSSLAVTHRYLDFTSDELEITNNSYNPLSKITL